MQILFCIYLRQVSYLNQTAFPISDLILMLFGVDQSSGPSSCTGLLGGCHVLQHPDQRMRQRWPMDVGHGVVARDDWKEAASQQRQLFCKHECLWLGEELWQLCGWKMVSFSIFSWICWRRLLFSHYINHHFGMIFIFSRCRKQIQVLVPWISDLCKIPQVRRLSAGKRHSACWTRRFETSWGRGLRSSSNVEHHTWKYQIHSNSMFWIDELPWNTYNYIHYTYSYPNISIWKLCNSLWVSARSSPLDTVASRWYVLIILLAIEHCNT